MLKIRGKMIAFDSNYRPNLWPTSDIAKEAFEAMWQVASIGFPSQEDERLLYPIETEDELLARLTGCGLNEIAVKRGEAGPLLWDHGPVAISGLEKAKSVVDTTGAGDAFNAGYLAARLNGQPSAEAAGIGHALASKVISCKGAIN
jgi:2-dehydro-3-deoxygluconokinase